MGVEVVVEEKNEEEEANMKVLEEVEIEVKEEEVREVVEAEEE